MADPKGTDPKQDPTGENLVTGNVKEPGSPKAGEEPKYSQSDMDSITNKVLTNALEKWQAEADARQDELLKKINAENLEADGKWQELAETQRVENEALKAANRRAEFKDNAAAALKELGVSQFGDLLTKTPDTIDGVKARGVEIQAMIDKGIQAGVEERLQTGTVPKKPGGTTIPSALKHADMGRDEKLAYIKEHGAEEYQKLVEAHV